MERVFGVVGRSGSGKTTLIEAMIPWFNEQGLEVAVIKHSHHNLQFEPPQKDSSRFRTAGAREVIVASPYHYALFHWCRTFKRCIEKSWYSPYDTRGILVDNYQCGITYLHHAFHLKIRIANNEYFKKLNGGKLLFSFFF